MLSEQRRAAVSGWLSSSRGGIVTAVPLRVCSIAPVCSLPERCPHHSNSTFSASASAITATAKSTAEQRHRWRLDGAGVMRREERDDSAVECREQSKRE